MQYILLSVHATLIRHGFSIPLVKRLHDFDKPYHAIHLVKRSRDFDKPWLFNPPYSAATLRRPGHTIP